MGDQFPTGLHEVELRSFTGSDLGRMVAMDYEWRFIHELSIQELFRPGLPSTHAQQLMESIQDEGVLEPVEVLFRGRGIIGNLMDGHHRSVISFHLNLPAVPARVTRCFCPDEDLDFLGLCPQLQPRSGK